MTTVQYIKPVKFEAQMFKVIAIDNDNDSNKHLKILTSYNKGKPCNLLFIKSKKLEDCDLIPREYYSLKVNQTDTYRNKPVLRYDLEKCYTINSQQCSIDYSSDSE